LLELLTDLSKRKVEDKNTDLRQQVGNICDLCMNGGQSCAVPRYN